MKKLSVILFFIFSFTLSFGQTWDWGRAGYGSLKTNDYGSPVATDKNGNAYITGQYSNSVTFGSITLNGSGDNAYLTKYNSAGTVLWAVQPIDSANASSFGTSLAIDKSGNIYITGSFLGTITFGAISLRANNSEDVFLVKYSSSGNVLWAKQSICYNYYYGQGYSVITDDMGNAFVAGYFSDTISFGAYTLLNSNSYSATDVFLVKYDPSGNVIWANQSVEPSNSCDGVCTSVSTDNVGNAYITGYFETAIFFGPYRLISLNNNSVFLAKYSSGGDLLWAKQSINTNSISSSAEANSVITDKSDNIYITGYFDDSVSFGGYELYSYSGKTTFLAKYDSGGNALWVKQSSEGLMGTSLSTDNANHIYLSCISYINDTIFSFGSLVFHTIAWANGYSFLFKFDTAGVAACGSILQNVGSYYYSGNGIASDSSGNYVYMAGVFDNDTVFCGGDTLVSNTGGATIFVGRWQNCSADAGINSIPTPTSSVSLFPNPNNGVFTLVIANEVKQSQVEVYNMLGEKVYSAALKQVQGDNTIDMSGKPNGVYLYRVLTEDGKQIGTGKFIME